VNGKENEGKRKKKKGEKGHRYRLDQEASISGIGSENNGGIDDRLSSVFPELQTYNARKIEEERKKGKPRAAEGAAIPTSYLA